jgi:hypothetical protein
MHQKAIEGYHIEGTAPIVDTARIPSKRGRRRPIQATRIVKSKRSPVKLRHMILK